MSTNNDGKTRRLQPLGTDWRPPTNRETERLNSGASAESADDGLLCLRCGGMMVETCAWALHHDAGDSNRVIGLTLRDEAPTTVARIISCSSASCVECGYTELYADQRLLRAALIRNQNELDDQEQRKQDTRRLR